ncbi:P24 [Lymantria xylina nucleopolyhedrovirus]|uniref:P24 n=1 Tax=Lymantria xylina multiple nucleopolyhedrovirus TaxID=2847840 RepID=D4N2F9_9ABAC|nr:P24 [Lymantria xylina nucleopolyhedrovirus]ADD73831.1 P24 [Lymantria xylina nucleopolyhedrovirus]
MYGSGSVDAAAGGAEPRPAADFTEFSYPNETLEVLIIENGDDDRDGYVEVGGAARLLAPLVTIRNFNAAVLWANTVSSQKMTRQSKNFVHVFAIARYLSGYNLSAANRPAEYYLMKRLICDLLLGAQGQNVDPLADIKSQLCTLQECLGVSPGSQIYAPTTEPASLYGLESSLEKLSDSMRAELSAITERLKSIHMDLTSKLAFSNDAMLDTFKSLKDLVLRKKQ